MKPSQNEIAIILDTMERTLALFERIGRSGLLPQGISNAVDAAVIAGYSASLGRDPMWGLRNMHVVKGKPILSADAMLALALAHPDCMYIRPIETSDTRAVYAAVRRSWGEGAEPFRFEFSEADARKAGLWGSGNWAKYPKAMLRARCVSGLCRAVFPDAVAGIYESTSGELGAQHDHDIIDVEVVPPRNPPGQADVSRPSVSAQEQPAQSPEPVEQMWFVEYVNGDEHGKLTTNFEAVKRALDAKGYQYRARPAQPGDEEYRRPRSDTPSDVPQRQEDAPAPPEQTSLEAVRAAAVALLQSDPARMSAIFFEATGKKTTAIGTLDEAAFHRFLAAAKQAV